MNAYYNKDLAAIHHTDYGEIAKNATKLVVQLLNSAGLNHAMLVDLGCGSGITAKILTDHGHDVTGVDYSLEMIELARQNAPKAQFIQQSIYDYSLPSCNVVTVFGEVFNYLFDNPGLSSLKNLISKIFDALTPEGLLVFDVLTTEVDYSQGKRIVEHDEWSMFIDIQINAQQVLSRDITIFKKMGEYYHRSKEIHHQKLFTIQEISEMLDNAGFNFEYATSYGGYELRQGHYSFFCRKQNSL